MGTLGGVCKCRAFFEGGRECLVIALDGGVVVNGITVRTAGGDLEPDRTEDI